MELDIVFDGRLNIKKGFRTWYSLIIYWDNDYDTDVWNIEVTQQAVQLWKQLKRKVQTDIADVGHRESTSLWKGLVKNWLSEVMANLSIKCHVYFQFSCILYKRLVQIWSSTDMANLSIDCHKYFLFHIRSKKWNLAWAWKNIPKQSTTASLADLNVCSIA